MSGADDIWVYHEVQESALCGQHCLNNLLQNAYFTAPDLSDIALDLDGKANIKIAESIDLIATYLSQLQKED